MKKNSILWSIVFIASMFLASCGGGSSDNHDENSDTTNTETVDTHMDETSDEFTMHGTLVSVEDSGLPYVFNVVIETEQGTEYLNYEGEYGDLDKFLNKKVVVKYDEIFSTRVADLICNGVSNDGEYSALAAEGGTPPANWGMITGTFQASDVSGDLPSEITITTTEGETHTLETFVYEETMDWNGQTVTAYVVDNITVNLVSIDFE